MTAVSVDIDIPTFVKKVFSSLKNDKWKGVMEDEMIFVIKK